MLLLKVHMCVRGNANKTIRCITDLILTTVIYDSNIYKDYYFMLLSSED